MRARRLLLSCYLLTLLVLLGAPLPSSAEPPERVVALLPLGKVRPEYLQRVAEELQARLAVQVRIEPARELPREAWYAPRRRWRADTLLDSLEANPPPGAWKVVAITEAEISTTKGRFADWGIAGLGLLGGKSCVVSTYIYKKHSRTRAALLRRVADLAVHEFGHTLGLDHCEQKGCVMSDAKGKALKSADESSGHYCAKCLQLLEPEIRVLVKGR